MSSKFLALFTRARFADDDDDAVLADYAQELLAHCEDGQKFPLLFERFLPREFALHLLIDFHVIGELLIGSVVHGVFGVL